MLQVCAGRTHRNSGRDTRENCLNGISIAVTIRSLDRIKRITRITRMGIVQSVTYA